MSRLMRLIHRWISFPLIIFLLAVTVTGIYLQWVEMKEEFEPHVEREIVATLPSDAEILSQVQQALNLARAQDANFPAQKIEYTNTGARQSVRLSTTERIGPSITVNLANETVTQEARPKRTVRTYFILLHSGKYFGIWGLILIMLASLILFVLSITGFIVYLDMYGRRRKLGKKGLFW